MNGPERRNPPRGFRDVLPDDIPTGLFWADRESVLVEVNATFCDLLHLRRASAIGRALEYYCVEPAVFREAFRRVLRESSVSNIDLRLRAEDGSEILALLSMHCIEDGVFRIGGALRDITKWKAALDSVLEEAENSRTIIDSMSEGAVLLNASGEILAANPSAQRMLGLTADEITGRSTHDPRWQTIREDGSPFPSTEHPVAVSLRTGEPRSNVLMGVHKPDGQVTWIRINSEPLFRQGADRPYAVTATFADVTAQRQLEAQFLQAQKLDALGHLAGGIAHDFNNMLTVVFNRCEMLMHVVTDEKARRYTGDILSAARQTADLSLGRRRLNRQASGLTAEILDGFPGIIGCGHIAS